MKQKSPIVQSKGTTAKKHEYKISSWGERPFGTNGFAEFHDEHKRGLQEYPPMSFSHRKGRSCRRERVFANPVSRTQGIASTNANLQRFAVYNEPILQFKGACSLSLAKAGETGSKTFRTARANRRRTPGIIAEQLNLKKRTGKGDEFLPTPQKPNDKGHNAFGHFCRVVSRI